MVTQIKEKLTSKGVNPSFHRIRIYQYLLNNRIHPSVEKIYSDLIQEIPSLSKTTVYNTLKQFGEKGLILSISIKDNEQSYDAYTHLHGHFLCNRCGELYDIEIPEQAFRPEEIKTEHKLTESHLNFKGICSDCENRLNISI